MATGQVRLGSDLERKQWMREGLVQAASKSFWSPLTGNTMDSVVFQAKTDTAGSGHTVVFDFDGNLSGKAKRGKETAFGTGEAKRKFSDKLTVERYRLVVDNGDKFDGANIGDLTINEHTDSRTKLGDLFVRFKDQSLFDAAQGLITTNNDVIQTPSHVIDLGTTFTWNVLTDIEKTIKTSTGFTTGGVRRPLQPYKLQNGEPVWLYIIDAHMAAMLRKDTAGYQNILRSADVRGDGRVCHGELATRRADHRDEAMAGLCGCRIGRAGAAACAVDSLSGRLPVTGRGRTRFLVGAVRS